MTDNTQIFERLYKDYHAMVHQVCMGFVKGQKDQAKDLTQETFINTWRALDNFKGASGYKTWIYRITVNTCLKYIRDHKKKDQVTFDQHENIQAHEEQAPVEDPKHNQLYMAIGQLEELDRLIIMMVLDELNYEEISEVVGISDGNLRVKIHRIKKRLKKILENE